MILPDFQITEWANSGGVTPFEPANVNPASIDLRLGGEFIDLATGDRFQADVIEIKPGDAILATTQEYFRLSPDIAGAVYLKSSLARIGLDHALAGWVDPGFEGELTLEFHAHRPVTLKKGQKVCQLVLYCMAEPPENNYQMTGRYNGQRGPTKAR